MIQNKDIELMIRTRILSGDRGSGQNACTRHVLKWLEWWFRAQKHPEALMAPSLSTI